MDAEELLDTIYRYYPRGLDAERAEYAQSEEHRRLVAARKAAGANDAAWVALLDRLQTRFSECVVDNHSVHLPTGRHDACYFGVFRLPPDPGEPPPLSRAAQATIARLRRAGVKVPNPDNRRALTFLVSFIVPFHVIYSDRESARFTFATDEQSFVDAIAREIVAMYKTRPMSAAVGQLIIPDLTADDRPFRTITIFDVVFSDHARWLR